MKLDSKAPRVSVITPSFNAAHYLERSLPPLIAMRERGEIAEVIVVDDCSTDPSNAMAAERFGATVLRMQRNGGPGAARNYAAGLASGDVLWFVDADVVAHETGAAMVRAAFADPGIGAIFGSYDDNPPADNFASAYKNLIHRYYHQRGREDAETFWAGCGAIRRDVYLDVGGFDGARYGRPSIEDIELGHRIRAAGWTIRLLPDLLGTHLKRWTLEEVVRTDIVQRAIPWSELILSKSGPSDDLNVAARERVKAILAAMWIAAMLAALLPPLWPWSLIAAAVATGLVAIANRKLLLFFARARGPLFSLAAAAWHQIYYVYSGVTFSLCAVRFHAGREKGPARASQVRAT